MTRTLLGVSAAALAFLAASGAMAQARRTAAPAAAPAAPAAAFFEPWRSGSAPLRLLAWTMTLLSHVSRRRGSRLYGRLLVFIPHLVLPSGQVRALAATAAF